MEYFVRHIIIRLASIVEMNDAKRHAWEQCLANTLNCSMQCLFFLDHDDDYKEFYTYDLQIRPMFFPDVQTGLSFSVENTLKNWEEEQFPFNPRKEATFLGKDIGKSLFAGSLLQQHNFTRVQNCGFRWGTTFTYSDYF